MQYALRSAAFHYQMVLTSFIEELRERLGNFPGKFEAISDGARILVSGSGDFRDEHIEDMHDLLNALGSDATRASMIEERVEGKNRIFFSGPSDTARAIMRHAMLEDGFKHLVGGVRSLFREYPNLARFRLDLITTGGAEEWLRMSDVEWAGAEEVTADHLLDTLTDGIEMDLDLRLIDGKNFHREDMNLSAAPASAATDGEVSAERREQPRIT